MMGNHSAKPPGKPQKENQEQPQTSFRKTAGPEDEEGFSSKSRLAAVAQDAFGYDAKNARAWSANIAWSTAVKKRIGSRTGFMVSETRQAVNDTVKMSLSVGL